MFLSYWKDNVLMYGKAIIYTDISWTEMAHNTFWWLQSAVNFIEFSILEGIFFYIIQVWNQTVYTNFFNTL
jgi:hypothetical protein